MMYLQKSFTVPAAPSKITACEACVYGRGPHALWCSHVASALGYRVGMSCKIPIPGHGSGPLPGKNAKIEWPINGRARWVLE